MPKKFSPSKAIIPLPGIYPKELVYYRVQILQFYKDVHPTIIYNCEILETI